MKKSFFTTIIFLWSTAFLSLQAQDCSAPPASFIDWTGCDKSGQDLTGVDLYYAILSGANLSNAYMTSANLNQANLESANLSGANLDGALLSDASLSGANLIGANLSNTTLGGANMSGANMSGADLSNAYLSNAYLNGANLNNADLSDANLTGVGSGGITGTPYALPSGWALIYGYLVGPGADLSNEFLQYADLSGADLSGADLSGADLYAVNLTGANLSNLNLTGANLTDANLTDANLSGTDLAGANLSGVVSGGITGTPFALPANWQLINGYLVGPGANLSNANLSNANLAGADLSYANLTGANLSNANLVGAYMVYASLTDANVTGANLSNVNFTLTILSGLNLSGANLAGAILTYTHLEGANLSGLNLLGANLFGAYLDNADLSNANLTGLFISGAIMPGANLSGANLSGANLASANLSNANLTNANLAGTTLYEVNFSGANMVGANMTNVDLRIANMSGADLTGANLTVSLSGGITGTPYALPAGWALVNGYLVRTFTVTFDVNGGTTPSPATVSVTYNAPYGALATASRPCYTFNGWFTESNGGTEITSASIVAINSDQTLYAQWTAINYNYTETIVACGSYEWHGTTYTTSNNTATWTGTNAAGCDSIVTLNLTLTPFTTNTVSVSACDSYTWPVNGQTYTASGTHIVNAGETAFFNSLSGLTSAVSTAGYTLSATETFNSYSTGLQPITGNFGQSSLSWTASATPNGTITAPSGGSMTLSTLSAVPLTISFNPGVTSVGANFFVTNGGFATVSGTITLTLSDGSSQSFYTNTANSFGGFVSHGAFISSITIATSNDFVTVDNLVVSTGTINACISEELNLTINHPSSSTETIVACGSYEWKGATYTTSNNTATWTGTNAAGCDSIVTLDLTINQPSYSNEPIVACGSYEWHGTTYTTSNNTATWTGISAAGCDSIVTLNLTIKSAPTVTITGNTAFCAGGNTVLTANATSGGGGSVMAIAAGVYHSLFLKSDGTVWATGRNTYGQLGDGTNVSKNTPVQVSGLSGITAMSAGFGHSLFIKNDGTVWATGSNDYGQLGDGTYEQKNTPVQVSGLSGIIAIAAGDSHSMFLKNDGTVWATGYNSFGQLGNGTNVSKNIPVPVSGLSGISAIAAGSYHSLFLKNDGTVWATGWNVSGQLGDGTNDEQKNTPVQVSGLSGISAIAAGSYHSLFLKNDGTVRATGENNYGQLGDGTNVPKNIPVPVSGLSGISAIAAGSYHSLFLKNDGTVWATGYNEDGQLGDGTNVSKNIPVPVSGLSGITAIAAGYGHSLFLKNDGTVWATGVNIYGGLGDGTNVFTSTPVPVSGFDVTITSYQWKLNGSDIAGATNATYTATAAGNYTFEVTNSNGCSTSESVNVTVNQPSTAPTSISSSVAFATAGVNFTLSVNGGSLGTSATWKWYTGSCGGTLIGTGASISVSQTANTTYFVRAEGTCNTTACATITVNSQCGATGITSSAGTTAICAGSPVTLTVVGSLSPGAQWRWDDECDNDDDDDDDDDDSYSNTATFTVSPNSTKTYYLRSVGGTCGLTACVPITVNVIAKPATPGTISGSASVCPSTSVTYTIAAVAGATSYTWTAPTNATLLSAQGGTSMTIAYASAFTSGTLKVKANNCSGSSSDKSLSIAKQVAPATPGNISGANAPCKGSTQTYSTSAVSGATSYTWTLPTGVSFVSGTSQTGTSIQVVVASTFSSGTLSVKANNCGGSSSNRTTTLTGQSAPTAPGTITGPSSVTQNTANNTFSVSNVAGMTYNWSVPAGCTITLGQGTSSIKVTWGTVAGTVSVTRNNGCGNSVASTKSVSVRRSEEAEADAGMESARTEETVETLVTATDALNAIAVYPNPTTGEARITFNTTTTGKYAISIVDLQGRVINSTSGAAIEGNNNIDINLSNGSNGVYMIHFMHNDSLQTLRVVKL